MGFDWNTRSYQGETKAPQPKKQIHPAPDELKVNFTQLYSALDKFLDSDCWKRADHYEEIKYAKWKLSYGIGTDGVIISGMRKQCNFYYDDVPVFSFVETSNSSILFTEDIACYEKEFVKSCECVANFFFAENTSITVINQEIMEPIISATPIIEIPEKNLKVVFSPHTGEYIKLKFENGKESTFMLRSSFGLFTIKDEIGKFGVWTPVQMKNHIQKSQSVTIYNEFEEEVSVHLWSDLSELLDSYLDGAETLMQKSMWEIQEHEPTESDFDYGKDAKVFTITYGNKKCGHASSINNCGSYSDYVVYRDAESALSPAIKKQVFFLIVQALINHKKRVLNLKEKTLYM